MCVCVYLHKVGFLQNIGKKDTLKAQRNIHQLKSNFLPHTFSINCLIEFMTNEIDSTMAYVERRSFRLRQNFELVSYATANSFLLGKEHPSPCKNKTFKAEKAEVVYRLSSCVYSIYNNSFTVLKGYAQQSSYDFI